MATSKKGNIRINTALAIILIVAVAIQTLVNIRISKSLRFDDSFHVELDEFVSSSTEGRRKAVTTAPSNDGPTQTKKEQETSLQIEKTETEEKPLPELPLTFYSYNTTNFDEFYRLHREYLISKQEKLGDSHLSTRARDVDDDANNMTTARYKGGSARIFNAGFRNQMIYVTSLMMEANYDGHKQFDVNSLRHKDTYGTEKPGFFEQFFDVEHWNKYSYTKEKQNTQAKGIPNNTVDPERYPNWLPRMVFYNDSAHQGTASNDTSLVMYIRRHNKMMSKYVHYAKGYGAWVPHAIGEKRSDVRNPAEILMYQGALRPHPALQAIVDRCKERMMRRGTTSASPAKGSSFRYMTLHARIEPDMQKHPVCRDKKVLTLHEIVQMIESKWSEPPVDVVFLPINRQYLEKEGTLPENFENETNSTDQINWIAVRNLELLNRLTNHDGKNNGKPAGLWNGKVPVVEFGTEALSGSVYAERPSISGSILNYFLAIDADIFIGTEVSSYSHDLLGARFYRGFNHSDTTSGTNREQKNPRTSNYKYLPNGLETWVTDDMPVPPNFQC